MKEKTKLPNLPSSDEENTIWDNAEVHKNVPRKIGICNDHTKDTWMYHIGYESDNNGGIICTKCPWGAKIPGYYKVLDGKIVDLRNHNSQ